MALINTVFLLIFQTYFSFDLEGHKPWRRKKGFMKTILVSVCGDTDRGKKERRHF